MKVLVLGAGNMGLTYAEGMATSPFLGKRKLMIYDVSPQKTEALSTMAQFDAYDSVEDCVPKADVIFLAVKPYHKESLFESLNSATAPSNVCETKTLESLLENPMLRAASSIDCIK